jgi:hypothetical protein
VGGGADAADAAGKIRHLVIFSSDQEALEESGRFPYVDFEPGNLSPLGVDANGAFTLHAGDIAHVYFAKRPGGFIFL